MCIYSLHVLAFAFINGFLNWATPIPVSRADLRAIAVAYQEHLDATGQPPAKADDLKRFLNDDRLYAALKKGDVVFYYGVPINGPFIAANGTSPTVLAHEKDAPHKGGLIVMFDGSVRSVSPDEFKKVILPPK